MSYVDGYVLPVPRKKLPAYRRMASDAGKVWMKNGALQYVESVADDVEVGKRTSFPRSVKLKRGEVVVFSFIVYRSRGQRDRINEKVMKQFMSDPSGRSSWTRRTCRSTASECSGAASSRSSSSDMQYMLLCCIDEGRWLALPDAERDAVMKDYGAWVADVERTGQHRATEKLAWTGTRRRSGSGAAGAS